MEEIREYKEGEITCPYCKWTDSDSWENPLNRDGDTMTYDCPECEKKFYVHMNIDVTYTSSGLCEENNIKHNWEYFDHVTNGKRCKGKKCLTCQQYEFDRTHENGENK